MSDSTGIAAAETAPLLDTAKSGVSFALAPQFQAAVQQSRRGAGGVVRAYAGLAFGPGRVSFADFIRLRLFDESFHPGAALDRFVGARRNRDLCVTLNHRHDWLGLLTNKVAALSYLAAYGFPTLHVLAMFAPGNGTGAARILPDREALVKFLSDPSHYPLFGKPVEGFQSLGSIGLRSFDPATGQIKRLDGRLASVEQLVEEIVTHYGASAGYLFQRLAAPHAAIAQVCGSRLATVRMVTTLTEDGPRLFRAAWKIPASGHAADNFWRAGNLLASLDLDTGRVGRAVSGFGPDGREVTSHPDTGAVLPDRPHPEWERMRRLALDGAALMRHVPLIGWDMACTAEGPVIVEMNEAPDFFLVQYAHGRGVLDDDFARFSAFQRKNAAAARAAGAAAVRRL